MLERGLAGSPQFGKKCRKKFTLPRQMGRAKISTIFFSTKYLKTSLTTTLILRRSINLLWTFIASYGLNGLSVLCLSPYFTRQTSGILQ